MFDTNNVVYVVGNKGILILSKEVYSFPSNKYYDWCATCRVGNNILVICKENFQYFDQELESSLFNPINRQWSDANIKIKREFFAVVYYLNKIWIIGGCERDDDGEWKRLNTVEVYDPVTKNQILAPIKMNEARSGHSVIVYKNKLFVFGGEEPLNNVEMFSPENQQFVMMAPMKIARSHFGCCRVGNLVYVIGGWVPDIYFGTGVCYITKSVEIYNLDSNTWTDGDDIPDAGRDCDTLYACAVNDKL